MESIIGWIIPILGVPASWHLLKWVDEKSGVVIFLAGFAASLALVIALVFIAVLSNSLCISPLHACENHGDANMSYWFNSCYFFPVYLLFAIVGKQESINTTDDQSN